MKYAWALALTLAAAPVHARTLVPVAIQDLFVPVGFDDNDETMVVLDGYLPNSCYRLAHNKAILDEATQTFRVTQYAWFYPESVCLRMVTPFVSEIVLGKVSSGSYKVETEGTAAAKLDVKSAMLPGPDDFTYAPIDEARVDYDAERNQYTAVIRGRFSNSCMNIGEMRLINSGRTLELLPIVSITDKNCRASMRTFEQKVELPTQLKAGRYMLHVRSLSGRALNALFSVNAPASH